MRSHARLQGYSASSVSAGRNTSLHSLLSLAMAVVRLLPVLLRHDLMAPTPPVYPASFCSGRSSARRPEARAKAILASVLAGCLEQIPKVKDALLATFRALDEEIIQSAQSKKRLKASLPGWSLVLMRASMARCKSYSKGARRPARSQPFPATTTSSWPAMGASSSTARTSSRARWPCRGRKTPLCRLCRS